MYQNSDSKKSGDSQSVMRSPSSLASSAWLSRSSSVRSCMEKPMEVTGTFARRRSTSLAWALDGCSLLKATVSRNTVWPRVSREGIDLNRSQVHS